MDAQRPDLTTTMSEISVTNSIGLRPISIKDHKHLWQLMDVVYSKAYAYLWEDEGRWYLHNIWNKTALERELKETQANYYFVTFQNKSVGILRIVENAKFKDRSFENVLKLHRLYLDDSVQGKGLGNVIMNWVEDYAKATKHKGVWLEVMDTKMQALKFYERCGYQITSDFKLDFAVMHEHLRGMHNMYKAI